jgi:predicted outer membrane repeat protein
VNISSSRFIGNRAAGAGGGVYVEEAGVVGATGCVFQGNECGLGFGGGMGVFRSNVSMDNTEFQGNEVRESAEVGSISIWHS